MKFISFLLRFVFSVFISLLFVVPILIYFKPIFIAESIVIPYAIYPFDICKAAPIAWRYMKMAYVLSLFYICFIFAFSFSSKFMKGKVFIHKRDRNPFSLQSHGIHLYLGKLASNNSPVYLSESSLFQNILITGTIGTGKTSSGMYPFARQLIGYEKPKLGMLILDVKGNFYKQVKAYAEEFGRLDDLHVIELGGNIKYNPLDKPHLKPTVLANRLKTILTLFSPNNSESYWLDKAEEVLAECIKLCRLYNDGYVTFAELHKLVNSPNYYMEKVRLLKRII